MELVLSTVISGVLGSVAQGAGKDLYNYLKGVTEETAPPAELQQMAATYSLESISSEVVGLRYLGDHPEVVRKLAGYLDTYLASHPSESLGWTILGRLRETTDEDMAARIAYQRALANDPHNAAALVGLGLTFRKIERDLTTAELFYHRALAVDPDNPYAWGSLGVAALARGDGPTALAHCQKAYALVPTDPVMAANLAMALHAVGNVAERDRMAAVAIGLGYSAETFEGAFRKLQAFQKQYKPGSRS